MARITSVLVAAALSFSLPPDGLAGDAFTGFQLDNESQYFAYFGARFPLMEETQLQPFAQLFAAGLGYSFKDNGQMRDAQAQYLVPAIGLKYSLGALSILGFAGPQLYRKEVSQANGTVTSEQAGVYVQGETFYWHEQGNVHAIFSYTDVDQFYWGRLRGKLLGYRAEHGCCSAYLGWDVTGMGNDDFHAALTGPLLELEANRFFLLVRGGYQYTQTFRSGAYYGLELYFPF